MTQPARLKKAIAARERFPFQQFGQGNDTYTAGGATGCTHTILQELAYLWLGRWYTHDQVSRLAGYPSQEDGIPSRRRGLRQSEVQRFCDKVGLPYDVQTGKTALQAIAASAKGPVGFGHSYSRWPEWKGYRYAGRVADGKPNGFASPTRHAGRTQLAGFVPPKDAHFGLILGTDPATGNVFAWEPNHGSESRPERPPYDFMRRSQFVELFDSYTSVLHRTSYVLVPTRSLPL